MNKILKCNGSCENHTDKVIIVEVVGWGQFSYCEAAIKEDLRRGLIVKPLEVLSVGELNGL